MIMFYLSFTMQLPAHIVVHVKVLNANFMVCANVAWQKLMHIIINNYYYFNIEVFTNFIFVNAIFVLIMFIIICDQIYKNHFKSHIWQVTLFITNQVRLFSDNILMNHASVTAKISSVCFSSSSGWFLRLVRHT